MCAQFVVAVVLIVVVVIVGEQHMAQDSAHEMNRICAKKSMIDKIQTHRQGETHTYTHTHSVDTNILFSSKRISRAHL